MVTSSTWRCRIPPSPRKSFEDTISLSPPSLSILHPTLSTLPVTIVESISLIPSLIRLILNSTTRLGYCHSKRRTSSRTGSHQSNQQDGRTRKESDLLWSGRQHQNRFPRKQTI